MVDSAADFLRRLDPLAEEWEGEHPAWVWRGQSETWPLSPAAYRRQAWLRLKLPHQSDAHDPQTASLHVQETAEREVLRRFYDAVNASALAIPGDEGTLLKHAHHGFVGHDWPEEAILPLLSLAQHSGIPTRLLDWTTDPRIAAYFAASGPSATNDGYIVVYALRVQFIHRFGPKGADGVRCRLMRAHHSTNPFMHAQRGIHLLMQGDLNRFDLAEALEKTRDLHASSWTMDEILRIIKLPRSRASKVLRLLAQGGVSARSVWPSYQGAADSLVERGRWDS
jgi:hypothetical protein